MTTLPTAIRSRTDIETAIVTWMASATGGTPVVGWPNAPRKLPLPYMSIKLSGLRAIGQDDKGPIDDDGVRTIYGDRVLTASINAFGAGALDLLRKLCNSVWQESITDALTADGIFPQIPGNITDLTQFLETEAEERAHVDMDLAIKDVYTDTPGIIEHVAGDGDFKADTGTTYTMTFAADLSP